MGKPADENFLVMRFTSKLKSLNLYLVKNFEDQ